MHPYRCPAPSVPSAGPAPAAAPAREPGVDLIGALLLAVGSLVGIAGMLSADGTLFAVGTAVTVVALASGNCDKHG